MSYIDKLERLAMEDVVELKRKDAEYGGSWLKRGGVGAYMMACRKFDRLETQVQKVGYDIFKAVEQDKRDEGVLDDIRDLRRYLLLIEAEIQTRKMASLQDHPNVMLPIRQITETPFEGQP